MGAATVSGQTLVGDCGESDTQGFEMVFMTTIFLMGAQIDGEFKPQTILASQPRPLG